MTEDEALESLCIRAMNKNLYFAIAGKNDGRPYGPTVGTVEGPELVEYRRLFGGKIAYGRWGKETWVVADDQAKDLIKKLLSMRRFKTSGKYHFALGLLPEAERKVYYENSQYIKTKPRPTSLY